MNLYTQLQRREAEGSPVKIGVIGASKFSSMFLSQIRFTPGMQLVAIAELDGQKAINACKKTGWPEEVLATTETASQINDSATNGKVAIATSAYRRTVGLG